MPGPQSVTSPHFPPEHFVATFLASPHLLLVPHFVVFLSP